ncbi:2-amino-4-hydroxy-6-hydroxymethyldihydropteridine diphosphokinase [Thalassococcus sp. CAU 1522]|uniref:2-amino-4-hydroxy-6-hydroxymethyldihydropteridine pyrophosphokinase n=1 Tax=Thalassococcus arenae TaxID=2851652 RepID=A0ABS6N4H4_9RHOB|nr:2-amino-4-hydroxy-6-hydroxymethyldihydropteridine diphosphokinase [Thalassococcus arenae]
MEQECLIALGSNLGSRAGSPVETVAAALSALADSGLRLRRVSRFFATPCFPAGAGPDYVNACAAVGATMPPPAVLALLHDIEARFARERTDRWGSRTLDLDLLAQGDAVLPDAATQTRWRDLAPDRQRSEAPETLILPHPRLQERAFVLVPLADIAPDWRHPLAGTTVRDMLTAIPGSDRASITAL